jgi:hypothetical protein
MALIQVDADLDEFETEDLVRELSHRQGDQALIFMAEHMDYESLIRLLERTGCPEHIISDLKIWLREPLRTKRDLDQWLAMCNP